MKYAEDLYWPDTIPITGLLVYLGIVCPGVVELVKAGQEWLWAAPLGPRVAYVLTACYGWYDNSGYETGKEFSTRIATGSLVSLASAGFLAGYLGGGLPWHLLPQCAASPLYATLALPKVVKQWQELVSTNLRDGDGSTTELTRPRSPHTQLHHFDSERSLRSEYGATPTPQDV